MSAAPAAGDPQRPVVDAEARLQDQCHQALMYADAAGWLVFDHVTPGGPRVRRYVITTRHGLRRSLPTDVVVPYVLGLADFHGAGHLFPDPDQGRA